MTDKLTVQQMICAYRKSHPDSSNLTDDEVISILDKPNNLKLSASQKISLYNSTNNFEDDTDVTIKNSAKKNTNNLVNKFSSLSFWSNDLNGLNEELAYLKEEDFPQFLNEHKKVKGESVLDTICGCKIANNSSRKEILLTLTDKMETCLKNNNNLTVNNENLLSTIREDINYQFRKIGFVNTTNIGALFDVLSEEIDKKPEVVKPKSFDEAASDFVLNESSSKKIKEETKRLNSTVLGKTVEFRTKKGEKVTDSYFFDNDKKNYILEQRSFYNPENKLQKIAIYNNNGTLANAFYYDETGKNPVESVYYRNNGKVRQRVVNKDGLFVVEDYGLNGNIARKTVYRRDKNNQSETELIVKNNYQNNGIVSTYYDKESNKKDLKSYILLEDESPESLLKFLYSLPVEKIGNFQDFTMNILESFQGDKRTFNLALKNIMEKVNYLAAERKIDISDLKKKLKQFQSDSKPYELYSVLDQAIGRVTKSLNYIDEKDYDNTSNANGKIDMDFKQGHFGSCWLTSAIKSLTVTEEGQELLKNIVQKDSLTGNIKVFLPGAPKEHQNFEYTQEEITNASELSTGDGDARAIEMAFRDLFIHTNVNGKYHKSISGNNMTTAFKILTNGDAHYIYDYCDAENPERSEVPDEVLDRLAKSKNVISQCGFKTEYNSDFFPMHAYTLSRVDNENVYIINPHDTSKELHLPRETFKKIVDLISIVEIPKKQKTE